MANNILSTDLEIRYFCFSLQNKTSRYANRSFQTESKYQHDTDSIQMLFNLALCMKKLGLKPVIGANPRILILGSLPGDESIRRQEYYGNPRNMFWDVMSGILGEKAPVRYSEKVEYLKRYGIALWDVLHAAERKGSLDANIRNEEFNDIEQLISDNPSIKVVVTNGGKAEKSFRKYLRHNPSVAGKKICHCASTSPMSICAGWNLGRLIDQWSNIL